MIFYNAQTNGFYISGFNNIPENSKELTTEYHAELLKKQSEGFVIQANDNGYPVAVERVLTLEEIKSINESKQQQLLNRANEKITMLQRIVKYNRATNDERKLLEQLELYTVELHQVDTSDINAVFPDMPE
ncbi:hypothetical protein A9G11_03100 [Gilliamella sp. wkB108]|uniref:tail fiber assembly protein n=1 Tax=Gilliamella sp. wkB108 TaxID=3120256 RepID=UPI00080DA27E|nr:tail fiber assembly protein [Gilliamella apicola]OCG24655.1 hypothetical protein A9G11_03100 [Gilliamella apicola]